MPDKLHDKKPMEINQDYPPEATEEEMFFADLGDEQIKRSIPFLNETLGRLLTLGTAMVAVSIAVLKDDSLIMSDFKKPAIVFFLLGATIALIGIVPFEAEIIRRSPTSIKRSFDKAMNKKKLTTGLAGGCLIIGFILLILGALFK